MSKKSYLFTGRRYDPETGLYYYRARYYNPTLGRFLQVDPIGYRDSMNLYLYALNNPINFIDPLGLCAESYFSQSIEQVMLGNYSDNVTLLGTAGQLALGLAGVDLPADLRDIWYDVTHWENSWGHVGQTALDAAAVFPLVGMLKYGDEAGVVVKSSTEVADDFIEKAGKFLGDDFQVITPQDGSDLILRSVDKTKQIRFDLTNPHGLEPHVNIETFERRNLYPGDQRMSQTGNIHVFPKNE